MRAWPQVRSAPCPRSLRRSRVTWWRSFTIRRRKAPRAWPSCGHSSSAFPGRQRSSALGRQGVSVREDVRAPLRGLTTRSATSSTPGTPRSRRRRCWACPAPTGRARRTPRRRPARGRSAHVLAPRQRGARRRTRRRRNARSRDRDEHARRLELVEDIAKPLDRRLRVVEAPDQDANEHEPCSELRLR